ncbi:phosphomannomutase/phosphoglucomutase [bacterium]|nr:phosphomannomutase/phosphoglucomutase [bacterium]
MKDFSYILPAFKAYDIRGRVPQELNSEAAFRIGAAFAKVIGAKKAVIGRDIRLTSPELSQAFSEGLMSMGVDVTDIGLCGTEEIYYACGRYDFDGGVMVTASHNPKDYNGIKMVLRGAKPLGKAEGLSEICALASGGYDFAEDQKNCRKGGIVSKDIHGEFADYVLSLVDLETIAKAELKVLANCGNGGANVVLQKLVGKLPAQLVIMNGEPDGSFPNGIPNPLLPENRQSTSEAVLAHKANLGAAWDGDFDRCFFFDEKGRFIEGYYLVGLFAERFLKRFPGASIIHDPRLCWNTREIIENLGGVPVESKTGHAFIKQAMRDHQAVYGGEMSAHQYFKDFFFCDSGILPLLMLMELLGQTGKPLSELVGDMMEKYPVSGEINYKIDVPAEVVFTKVKEKLQSLYGQPLKESRIDGLSLEYAEFRLNLRTSNTEPLLRLNAETRQNKALVAEIVKAVESALP